MYSIQQVEQRVAVLIDVQNMYYSAKNMFNAKVNFSKIMETAVAKRKLVRAIAYVIRADIPDEDVFHHALEKTGLEVKSKSLQTFVGGAKKGDWDIGIAMDAVRLCSKVDTVVLVSGDGDFKDLLKYLSAHGCRTEVLAFNQTASIHIKQEADLFVDMEKDLKRYLVPLKPRQNNNYQNNSAHNNSNQNNNNQNKPNNNSVNHNKPVQTNTNPNSTNQISTKDSKKPVKKKTAKKTGSVAPAKKVPATPPDLSNKNHNNMMTNLR